MKKILYIHGLKRGTGNTESQTATSLRRVLDKDRYSIIAPTFPTNGEEALNLAKKIMCEEQIDIVIGSSLGGFITLCLRGIPKIVINPCIRPDLELPKRGNSTIAHSYTGMVDTLWDNISSEEQVQTIGVFSDNDELFSYKDEFLEHYPQFVDIEDGHRISHQNIYFAIMPIIKTINLLKYASNYSNIKYDGIKLAFNVFNKIITVAEDNSNIDSLEPIEWKYGHYKCVSLFNRYFTANVCRLHPVVFHDEWQYIDNEVDILKHQERIDRLVAMLDSEYDVIICSPTHFKFNQDFYNAVCQRVNCDCVIMEDFFGVINLIDVDFDYCGLVNDGYEEAWNGINRALWRGIESLEEWEYTSFDPSVIDPKYRKYLQHKVTANHRYCDLLDIIENKRILILDDTILGDSLFYHIDIPISVNADSLLNIYQPKSVCIVTLFAPLPYDDNHRAMRPKTL